MSTTRLPVGLKRVSFFDGQQLTRDDMRDEQNRNVGIDAATVANFMGSGVLGDAAEPTVILDTADLNPQQQALLDAYGFDGQNVYIGSPLNQVSDPVKGVMLAVTIDGAGLAGAVASKVSVIGETFGGTVVHDDLVFDDNGMQMTRNRYRAVLGILFNDFAGNLHGSLAPAYADGYSFVGRCVVREAEPMEVSPDSLMAWQNAQPNQFFGDFKLAKLTDTLESLLQDIVGPSHSASDLGIVLESVDQRQLPPNDVTTRIGQKFLATGTNIQKISVLLSVLRDDSALPGDEYRWSGQIVLDLHALQTTVDCPVKPVPANLEDFDPDPTTLAQLSLDATDLARQGIALDGYARKVDFVFTGASVSDPGISPVIEGRYYVLTVGRSGNANVGTILLEEAVHTAPNGYEVVFDGSQWINIYENDMWFEVHGDYVKVADGIAYEDGIGVEIPRLAADASGVEQPNFLGGVPLAATARNADNFVLVEIQSVSSDNEQDPRTGNPVPSRVAPAPSVSSDNASDFQALLDNDVVPLALALVRDANPRGNPPAISGATVLPGAVYADTMQIIAPNADLLSNNMVGSIMLPDTSSSFEYRIVSVVLYTDAYGDVDGDGEVTVDDLAIVNSWMPDGYDLSDASPGGTQDKLFQGKISLERILRADVNGDGVVDASDVSLIQQFLDKSISVFPAGSSFQRMAIAVENELDPLSAKADMPADNPAFSTKPFPSIPWEIDFFATWLPDRIDIGDMRRLVPTTFTDPPDSTGYGGRNDFLVPGNLLLGGFALKPDGEPHPLDFEVADLSLHIPVTDSHGNPTILDGYVGFLLFDSFVAEASSGRTAAGFPAMRYSDRSFVQLGDFTAGRVRISASIQSLANNWPAPFSGNVEDVVGLFYDPATSLLMLRMKNLLDDGYGNLIPAQSLRVLVTVYLKRAGFANGTQQVTDGQMRTLLGI
jgi:hypothetical protein